MLIWLTVIKNCVPVIAAVIVNSGIETDDSQFFGDALYTIMDQLHETLAA